MKVKDKRVKDKFYKLAKETGYRSRASFKLIQLNRKYEFLQKSRVLIDLCAAPGGWLQVAQQSMPVSSLIIGVDLVPIKPIPNVIFLQEDITTERCRLALKKELKTWKVDTILHDGAPNVGKNWLHDAFSQTRLTLSALKLASEMLVKGGWFITKIFRSKDYNTLLWVFKKLFKKVHVTKPQASRNESAEIYVICQSYISPDKIDNKFFDPSHLFEDVESKSDTNTNIFKICKKKKKAEGYDENIPLVNQLKASDFIFCNNHLERLSQCTEIIFDDEDILAHKLTTNEIKEYCSDVKVLGGYGLRCLLKWKKSLQEVIKHQEQNEEISNVPEVSEVLDIEQQEADDALMEANDLQMSRSQDLKRKKKKMLREKRKLHERINLKMIIRDDEPIIQEDIELFKISQIKSKQDLDKLDNVEPELSLDSEVVTENGRGQCHQRRAVYNRNEIRDHGEKKDIIEQSPIVGDEIDSEDIEIVDLTYKEDKLDFTYKEDGANNPLLINLNDSAVHLKETVEKWFDREDFNEIDDENEIEINLLSENYEGNNFSSKGRATSKNPKNKNVKKNAVAMPPITPNSKSAVLEEKCENIEMQTDTVEISPTAPSTKKKKKKVFLDPEGLALGTLMIQSKKVKRDLIDNAYNRYASNDDGLPDWFVKDEQKHYRKLIPVSSEMVSEYRDQLKEINARPIKKVIEAKARKKKKALKRLEKARKKAEAITESLDMSEKEKMSQLKTIYKKAQGKRENTVTYVVAKKAHHGKVKRPPGVKGRYKVVDKRMKKDKRKMEGKQPPRRKKPNIKKQSKK